MGCSLRPALPLILPPILRSEPAVFASRRMARVSILAALGLLAFHAGNSTACARPSMLAEKAPQHDGVSREQHARLRKEIARLPADLRTRFEELYRDWRKSWERPDILVKSDAKAVRNTGEFEALVALGPRILPLVVNKLLQRREFFALQLYDVLQDRPELRATGPFGMSEQARALASARLWLSR